MLRNGLPHAGETARKFYRIFMKVFIEVPGVFIDKAVPKSRARVSPSLTVNPFADKASNISRWLLAHSPGHAWGVRELASLANVSCSAQHPKSFELLAS